MAGGVGKFPASEAPGAGRVRIGLTGGAPVAAPELPVAPASPLDTFPASTTAAGVDPVLAAADVTNVADAEPSAGGAGVGGAGVAVAAPEVDGAPDPVAPAVEPESDPDVAVAGSEPVEAEEAGAVQPEPAVEADSALDAQDAAAGALPAAGDTAAAAHWDGTGMLDAEADAVASSPP